MLMQRLRFYICILLLLLSSIQLFAQQSIDVSPGDEEKKLDNSIAPFTIRNIIITGNKKTKSSVILRELPFKPADQFPLQQLVAKFDDARRQLMNTTLFHEVIF